MAIVATDGWHALAQLVVGGLLLLALANKFVTHFTTAMVYYFTALAIGVVGAQFWPITFGSTIQILGTVFSPTIAGEGAREAFQAVLLSADGSPDQHQLVFTTNVADEVILDADHPLRLNVSEDGEPFPYVMVRDGLEAKLNRNVWYQLADLLESRQYQDEEFLGVVSCGQFFPLCSATALASSPSPGQ